MAIQETKTTVKNMNPVQHRQLDAYFSEGGFARVETALVTTDRFNGDLGLLRGYSTVDFQSLESGIAELGSQGRNQPFNNTLRRLEKNSAPTNMLSATMKNELALIFLISEDLIDPVSCFTQREISDGLRSRFPKNSGVRVAMSSLSIDGYPHKFHIPRFVAPSLEGGLPAFFSIAYALPSSDEAVRNSVVRSSTSLQSPAKEIILETVMDLAAQREEQTEVKINFDLRAEPIIKYLIAVAGISQREIPFFDKIFHAHYNYVDWIEAVSLGLLAGRFENPGKWREHFRAIDRLIGMPE